MQFPDTTSGYKFATHNLMLATRVSDLCFYDSMLGVDAPKLNLDTKKLDQNAASLDLAIAF